MTEIETKYRDWFTATTGCVPVPDCKNCIGTGVFADDGEGNPTEPCIFCIEDYEAAHPIEPDVEGGDITTEDHCKFYQYGKLVLNLTPEDDHVAALKAFMDKERFWPACYWISDHGNAHLIDLS